MTEDPPTSAAARTKPRILLLTNGKADGVGGELADAATSALLRVAMRDLGFHSDTFIVDSAPALDVQKRRLVRRKSGPSWGNGAAISDADLVVMDGSALSGNSGKRARAQCVETLALARAARVPVLAFNVGDADLGSTGNAGDGSQPAIKVASNPLALLGSVFGEIGEPAPRNLGVRKTKVGLAVTRVSVAGGSATKVTDRVQFEFWRRTIELLTALGYDYELLTDGPAADEDFLDVIIRNHGGAAAGAMRARRSPQSFLDELVHCDGVVATGDYANIAAFAYAVPSVGFGGNHKVKDFFESGGYSRRAVAPDRWHADAVVAELERAMAEGVFEDTDLLMSAYLLFFRGIKAILCPQSPYEPNSYDELRESLLRDRHETERRNAVGGYS